MRASVSVPVHPSASWVKAASAWPRVCWALLTWPHIPRSPHRAQGSREGLGALRAGRGLCPELLSTNSPSRSQPLLWRAVRAAVKSLLPHSTAGPARLCESPERGFWVTGHEHRRDLPSWSDCGGCGFPRIWQISFSDQSMSVLLLIPFKGKRTVLFSGNFPHWPGRVTWFLFGVLCGAV